LAGSAAITLAAAARGLAERFFINDLNQPLVNLWRAIVETPEKLARPYETLWRAQHGDRRLYYEEVRDEFNRAGRPDCLLHLLARCVKAAVRYNANGEFNQSPDHRRMGALPTTMRQHILGASYLLRGKRECSSLDYKEVVAKATPEDLIYLDPPYQGVCGERDPRYLKGVPFDEFVEVLEALNFRDIKYLVSYDGRTGARVHGRKLPERLRLHLIELEAGRSSQATLLGRAEMTVESSLPLPGFGGVLEVAPPLPALAGQAVGAHGKEAMTKAKLPPDAYSHVAMREARRADIMWTGAEVESYERKGDARWSCKRTSPPTWRRSSSNTWSRTRGCERISWSNCASGWRFGKRARSRWHEGKQGQIRVWRREISLRRRE
jgi:DNA adenine methylase